MARLGEIESGSPHAFQARMADRYGVTERTIRTWDRWAEAQGIYRARRAPFVIAGRSRGSRMIYVALGRADRKRLPVTSTPYGRKSYTAPPSALSSQGGWGSARRVPSEAVAILRRLGIGSGLRACVRALGDRLQAYKADAERLMVDVKSLARWAATRTSPAGAAFHALTKGYWRSVPDDPNEALEFEAELAQLESHAAQRASQNAEREARMARARAAGDRARDEAMERWYASRGEVMPCPA